jgi:pilus assembly protein Flp/PilA
MRIIFNFFSNDSAATSIEYALIAGGLSIAIIAAINALSTSVNAQFNSVSTALK